MKQLLGFLGAAAIVSGGALFNAPEPPPEVRPEPVVAAPSPSDANDPTKIEPGAVVPQAPQGG
ncbi:MAG: hypothetical protein HY909_00725 [Deltaproteobacteria bacterium]|nr:hypothetical protein [Deltaproteobacteria bacterium]